MSAVVSSVGSLVEGEAGGRAGEYNASVAEQNANLSVQQAAIEEQRQRIAARKSIGGLKAGYGASGVTMEGSAADVLENSAANAELDALLIRHGGRTKANQFGAEATLSRYKGYSSRVSGQLGGASSLLSNAEKAAASGGKGGG